MLREALDLLDRAEPLLQGELAFQFVELLSPTDPEVDSFKQTLDAAIVDTSSERLSAQRLFLVARDLQLKGRYGEAEATYANARDAFEKLDQSANACRAEMSRAALVYLLGNLDLGIEAGESAFEYCTSRHQRQWAGFVNQGLSTLHLMRGDLERYRQVVDRIPEENFAREQLTGYLLCARGLNEEAHLHMPPSDWRGSLGMMRAVHAGRAKVLWYAGETDSARTEYERWLQLWSDGFLENDDLLLEFGFYNFDEVFYELADKTVLRRMADSLNFEAFDEVRCMGHAGSTDRLLANLLLHLGKVGEARSHAMRGLLWCGEQHAIVEQARCEQLLADIELTEGNREAALRLLDGAAATYDRFGLGLYLKQVIEKKEILKA